MYALSDGIYDIAFKTWKTNEDVVSGMDNRFAKTAKLVVKDGKMTVQMTIHMQNEMIERLQIQKNGELIDMVTVEGAKETATRIVSFPIENLQDMVQAHVNVNLFGTIVEQDFRIQLVAPEEAITEEVVVTVFKSGTAEISAMQAYIADKATVTKTATSTTVALTFPNGAMIQDFQVEGAEVKLADEVEGKEASTYTFEVGDLKNLVNATVKVSAGNYQATHSVQLRFDIKGAVTVVENPFTDIATDENKAAILNLYARDIIKKAEKFNPRNNITRGQFALMLARTLNLSATTDAGFKDVVLLTDEERKSAINALAEAGIVKKGEYFNPNHTLTRQQSALMIYRAIGYATKKELDFGATLIYADEAQITNEEARKAFALLYAGEMMTGSKDNNGDTFIYPNKEVKRTYIAKILHGSLKYMVDK